MFDKELMKQLATIPAENRAEWFAERDKLSALAKEMNRLNVDDMVKKYGVARVMRVLAATIKCCPEEYDPSAIRMAYWVPLWAKRRRVVLFNHAQSVCSKSVPQIRKS